MRDTESIAFDDDGLIWPIKKPRKQFLVHVGTRKDNESAIIVCEGECSSRRATWTTHVCVKKESYECVACRKIRRWGLDIW